MQSWHQDHLRIGTKSGLINLPFPKSPYPSREHPEHPPTSSSLSASGTSPQDPRPPPPGFGAVRAGFLSSDPPDLARALLERGTAQEEGTQRLSSHEVGVSPRRSAIGVRSRVIPTIYSTTTRSRDFAHAGASYGFRARQFLL